MTILIQNCYEDEQSRFEAPTPGRPIRLPIFLNPIKFEGVWIEPQAFTRDTDPDMECEFFETRQVGRGDRAEGGDETAGRSDRRRASVAFL